MNKLQFALQKAEEFMRINDLTDFHTYALIKEALEQPEVSDAELISYRQGYEQGRFDYEMDLELGKIERHAQEPVMYMPSPRNGLTLVNQHGEPVVALKKSDVFNIPLYTHPAPVQNEFAKTKSWQGLSNDRIREIGDEVLEKQVFSRELNWIDFARAIEQALKEKNYG